jgi:hypothetical protein
MYDMSDSLRLTSDAGPEFKRLREARGLSAVKAAALAGKSRDTLYRFEAGEDVALSTVLAFLSTVGCTLQIARAGTPTLEEMRRRFADEGDHG